MSSFDENTEHSIKVLVFILFLSRNSVAIITNSLLE